MSADIRIIKFAGIAVDGSDVRSYARVPAAGDNDAALNNIAQATAHELAEAVAQADAYCKHTHGKSTRASGLADTNAEAVEPAQAEVFASATTCGCDVEPENSAEVHVWEEIFLSAAPGSYAETCASTFRHSLQLFWSRTAVLASVLGSRPDLIK